MQWLTSFFGQEISSCQKCIWETAGKVKMEYKNSKKQKTPDTVITKWVDKKQRKGKRIIKKQETPDTYIIYQNELGKLCFQGVSQKFPIWAVRPKLGISELWSRGFGEQGPQKTLAIWHLHVFFISNSIFRVNVRFA